MLGRYNLGVPDEKFATAVLAVAESIPAGRVMTYGDVALAVGSRAARAVGHIMARHGDEVPWWRVVPASGKPIAGHAAESLAYYRDEGTPLVFTDPLGMRESAGWRIDLTNALWFPPGARR